MEPITEALTFDSTTVLSVLALFVPVVTALFTKITANPWIKQGLTVLLSIINGGFVADTQLEVDVASRETVLLAVVSLVLALVSYLGIWRPHNLNAKVAPTFGLG